MIAAHINHRVLPLRQERGIPQNILDQLRLKGETGVGDVAIEHQQIGLVGIERGISAFHLFGFYMDIRNGYDFNFILAAVAPEGNCLAGYRCALEGRVPKFKQNALGMHLISVAIQMLLFDLHHMNRVVGFDIAAGSVIYSILFAIIGVGEVARPLNAGRPCHSVGITGLKHGRMRRKNGFDRHRHKADGLI